MKCNEAYLKAVLSREVPISVLAANALALEGKDEHEQDRLREEWAKDILEKFPPKKSQ